MIPRPVTHRFNRLLVAFGSVGAAVTCLCSSVQAQTANDRQWISLQIRDNAGITLDTSHPSGISDYKSTARANIVDSADGKKAYTSYYSDVGTTLTWLDPRLVNCMVKLNTTYGYTYRVSEIAGGDHSSTSKHYYGRAFDVYIINGQQVSSSNPYYKDFMQRCRDMGATEVLGPGDSGHSSHVHAGWSDNGGNVNPGLVFCDNRNSGFSVVGSWSTGTSATDKFYTSYRYRSTAAVSEPANFVATLPSSRSYTVYAWWTAGSNRSATAPYVVYHPSGSSTVRVNQQANGGVWNSLGSWSLNAGENKVALSCWTTTGYVVIADAIKWQ